MDRDFSRAGAGEGFGREIVRTGYGADKVIQEIVMIRRSNPGAVLALTLVLAGAGGGLLALPAQATVPAKAGGHMMDQQSMMRHIDGRLAMIKAELKITGAQMPLWNDYAAAVRSDIEPLDALRHQMFQARTSHASAPQWLDLRQKMMAAVSVHMAKVATALTPLYNGLDPAQKKIADELLGPHWGHGHHRHH